MLQPTFPVGFIAPCLPTKTDKLPSGSRWLHEIKRDGFRVIARKTGARVRLYSRPGDRARDLGRLAAAADKGRALPAAQSFGTMRPRRLDLARPQLAPAHRHGRHRRDHRSPRRSDYRTLFYFHELLLRALRGNAKLASISLPPRLTIDRDEPGYRQWRAEIRSYQEAANARVKRLAKA